MAQWSEQAIFAELRVFELVLERRRIAADEEAIAVYSLRGKQDID